MRAEEPATKLVSWIKEQVVAARCRGVVLGMSGGIDSSVVAVLCKRAFPDTTLGVMMPCHSIREDEEHARLVTAKFSIPVDMVVLDAIYDGLVRSFPRVEGDSTAVRLAQANIKSRLRMVTLYYFANTHRYLVAGTGNRSELAIGYFTKWGDSGADILPIADLVKREVRDLAEYLGIPAEIVAKPPSAGLWPGQTDEGEMGLTYDELDRYLTGGGVPEAVRPRLEAMIAASEHKRRLPAVPGLRLHP